MLGALQTLDATNSVQPHEILGDALRSQLGLKLVKEPGLRTILVVDAAEPPTPD